MDRYDPLVAPDPAAWLALDEGERISFIEKYHEEHGIELPSVHAHAAAHTVVENQIALGEALPVREKVRQLMAQGLDRHDAIHAISWVLMTQMYDISKGKVADGDQTRRYFSALRRLSARKWLRLGD
jgi:hypothetical protein